MIGSASTIGQVLFNLLIVLSPIYFYQRMFTHSTKKGTQIFTGVTFGLVSILSIEFPIVLGDFGGAFLWDFRWIPFVICILYMERLSAAICGILLVGYRFILGGLVASFNVLCVALILFILFIILKKTYHQFNRTKKYLMAFISSIITYLVVMTAIWIHLFYLDQLEFFYQQGFDLYVQMATSYVIGMMIYAYITESILTNLRLMEQIHEAEKLNMVSELAASIAHEIRPSLTVIRGFIQLTKVKVGKELHDYMDTAIDELDRAETIISDYFNFAKPQYDTKTGTFKVNRSLKEIILLMQSYANIKGIKLESQLEENLYIKADQFKFKQALLNLVKNAIEATDHGSVKIITSYSKKNEYIIIQIMDTGSGMTIEQLQEISKPYLTMKSQGMGLGLMLTFRLIESMGGTLTFDSKLGKGTIAHIKIKGVQKGDSASSSSQNPFKALKS